MKKYLTLLISISLILVIGLFAWRGIYSSPNAKLDLSVTFNIEKGQGSKEIALNLEKEGLIIWGPLFRSYVLLTGVSGELQAGTYELTSSMNTSEIVEKFITGDVLKEEITVIEGWNLRDIGFYLENKGMFQAEELWELAGLPTVDYSKTIDLIEPRDFSGEYDFLKDKPKNIGLEGYLFPDTYQINKEETIEDIVRKALNNFNEKLTLDLRKETGVQNKTIFEVVTMASLLEKEVKTPEEKKLVSGILWKRLENGVPLQVDATIGYLTGKKTIKILKDDMEIDSLYNTYKYSGLPLGPICNPGLESIIAALEPENSNFWYYLSAPEGETYFSETLKEHNIKKAKYLK